MYSFRPAIKSEAKPLVGLYAESGCGKTLSALYLARGFAGATGRVGMIETEAGRGEAYASTIPGGYDVLPLRGDFSPRAYGEAITAAEKAGLAALIIDSASHEWEAVGGVLHMAAQNQEAGKTGVLVWQQPKMDHQRHFVQRLISTPIPLVIVCMRAKYPMVEKKGATKKEWVRSESLEPTQSENILFELFVHGWIDREHRFRGTKYTLDELRHVIRDGEPISLDTGQRLAEWAKGGGANTGEAERGKKVAPQSDTTSASVVKPAAGADTPEMNRPLYIAGITSYARRDKLTVGQMKKIKAEALGSEEADFDKADIAALADLYRDWPTYVQRTVPARTA